MQLFFTEDIESDICTLSEEESKHCVKVLRMGVGDELCVTVEQAGEVYRVSGDAEKKIFRMEFVYG